MASKPRRNIYYAFPRQLSECSQVVLDSRCWCAGMARVRVVVLGSAKPQRAKPAKRKASK